MRKLKIILYYGVKRKRPKNIIFVVSLSEYYIYSKALFKIIVWYNEKYFILINY